MLLTLGAMQANAGKDSDGYLLLCTMAGLGGTSSIALVASGGTDSYGPLVSLLGAAGLVGAAATTSDASMDPGRGIYHKLMVQVKTDHDTHLAGGEMTPFLQGLYREIRLKNPALAPDGTIDEKRLTDAMDRVQAMTEGAAP